jgi:hypothetical protein
MKKVVDPPGKEKSEFVGARRCQAVVQRGTKRDAKSRVRRSSVCSISKPSVGTTPPQGLRYEA